MSSSRLGFSPYVEGLDTLLQGGIPEGSWISIYGPPGSYKTLHALAFCLAGLASGERCVYVSTEMDVAQLKRQLSSLGWRARTKSVYEKMFTMGIVDDNDYGSYEVVWLDTDSLYWWAYKLNRIVSEEKEGGKRKKYYWYHDTTLLTHAIIIALGAVGVLERTAKEITIGEIEYSRVRDGLYESKYARFKVNKDVRARVVIDSISPYIEGRAHIAGRLLTPMKMRLAVPNVTYLLTSHESVTTEGEVGASIGHVVDGRLKLWLELSDDGVARNFGWIAKMRETEHSRKVHAISLEQRGDQKVIKWS